MIPVLAKAMQSCELCVWQGALEVLGPTEGWLVWTFWCAESALEHCPGPASWTHLFPALRVHLPASSAGSFQEQTVHFSGLAPKWMMETNSQSSAKPTTFSIGITEIASSSWYHTERADRHFNSYDFAVTFLLLSHHYLSSWFPLKFCLVSFQNSL